MIRTFVIPLLAGLASLPTQPVLAEGPELKVLILSGANNHDWRKTTPAIKATLEESGRFSVDVEENVVGLKPDSFAPYSVILSNFNTFGKNAPKGEWSEETKKAFLDHIAKGNGLVIVHAGSSVFYDWPEFQKLACGTWGKETSHGKIHPNQVTFTDADSPITHGLRPFWIRDEFWHDVSVTPDAKALASVTPDPAFKGSGKPENIIFSTTTGDGRGYAIFLGHDAMAMRNPAWRTLLQRGTEWAATGKVTIPPAENWPETKEDAQSHDFSWNRTDTSLTLKNHNQTIWRLVFDPSQPKSYFHPLATVEGQLLTGFEPKDHPWHRGLWWSWKYINGVNYWEENRTTGASEGVTELIRATVETQPDSSATAELHLSYHPPEQAAVISEKRNLSISAPEVDGAYAISWTSKFTAGEAPVKLERTLPPHQGGPNHGGYAGLSLRFPRGSEGFRFLDSADHTEGHGQSSRWVSVSGPKGGITILDHPKNPRHPSPWYLSNKPDMLFANPALLYNEPLTLAAHKSLVLSYQIIVHEKPLKPKQIETRWTAFAKTPSPNSQQNQTPIPQP